MSDIDVEVLNKYDIKLERTYRGRGGIICEGKGEDYKLLPYNRTKFRLEFMNELTSQIRKNGYKNVEEIVKNIDGELITTNEYQESYIVKKTFLGNECDVKNKKNVLNAMEELSLLHSCMRGIKVYDNEDAQLHPVIPDTPNVLMEYDRHIREIKRINTYLRGRKNKTEFEYSALSNIDKYYEKAVDAYEKLKNSPYHELENECKKKGIFVHGDYTYHNVITMGDEIAIVGFDKAGIGCQIKDVYYFVRKVMEKHNWNDELLKSMLDRYNAVRKMDEMEQRILVIMLSFPEKFWKVLNQYYNSNKSWIPERNIEKLNVLYTQETKKENCIDKLKKFI